jgi:hypothetical protein
VIETIPGTDVVKVNSRPKGPLKRKVRIVELDCGTIKSGFGRVSDQCGRSYLRETWRVLGTEGGRLLDLNVAAA